MVITMIIIMMMMTSIIIIITIAIIKVYFKIDRREWTETAKVGGLNT